MVRVIEVLEEEESDVEDDEDIKMDDTAKVIDSDSRFCISI